MTLYNTYSFPVIPLLVAYFPYLEKNKSRLKRSPSLRYVYPPPPQLLNTCTDIHET
jgi:hypothetical protein